MTPPPGVDRPVRVLCVTPSGREGRGGIDRLYYYLSGTGAADAMPGIDLRFAAARGDGSGAVWPLAFPGRLLALAWRMLRFRPHVVHVNFAMRSSALRKIAVIRLAKAFRARVAVHFHDSVPEASLARGGFSGRLFLSICRHADAVVALGQVAAGSMRRHGVRPERLRIVRNGIPDFAAELALPKPDRPCVALLLVGRVGAHKGVGVLLEALAILRSRDVGGWRCTIAGDGEVEAYRARAAGLGLSDAVAFTGWLDADAVHALMRDCEIVVLPSIAEALPLSLIEGACAGAALVATPVGDVGEIVREGENGRLVARSPAALAAALAELLSDRASLGRMQAAARRHYRAHLTIETFAADLRAIYLDLAARPCGVSATRISPRPGAG